MVSSRIRSVSEPSLPSTPLAAPQTLFQRIQRLPGELQLCIFDGLGYQDCIRLSQVNRWFHLKVQPEKCSELEKRQFVRDAQLWPKHNRWIGVNWDGPWGKGTEVWADSNGFACYRCYRVRPQSKFSRSMITRKASKQRHHDEHRFCIDCGLEGREYNPEITTLQVITDEWRDSRGAVKEVGVEWREMMPCQGCNQVCMYEVLASAVRCMQCHNEHDDGGEDIGHSSQSWSAAMRGLMTIERDECYAMQEVRDPYLKCRSCIETARRCRKDFKDQQQRLRQKSRRDAKRDVVGGHILECDGGLTMDSLWLE